jgi:hypothetical protein
VRTTINALTAHSIAVISPVGIVSCVSSTFEIPLPVAAKLKAATDIVEMTTVRHATRFIRLIFYSNGDWAWSRQEPTADNYRISISPHVMLGPRPK